MKGKWFYGEDFSGQPEQGREWALVQQDHEGSQREAARVDGERMSLNALLYRVLFGDGVPQR